MQVILKPVVVSPYLFGMFMLLVHNLEIVLYEVFQRFMDSSAIEPDSTSWYFLHFLVVIPLLAKFETPKELPKSISEPVLGGAGAEPAVAASKAMEKAR